MITKESFIKFINRAKRYQEEEEKWSNIGINLIDTELYNSGWELYDSFLDSHFHEEGIDIVNWWMFERNFTNPEYLANIDELWEAIKEYRKND